jgi:hypothetical protein
MSDNNQMSATDAAVISSMGNNPVSTLLAVGAGSGGGSFGPRDSESNVITTLAVANALSPQSGSSSSNNNDALNTVATLSLLNHNGGSLFGN